MGLREIPNLSILCLRAIVSPKCNTEKTFEPTKDGQPSTASRLLRSFHNRPVLRPNEKINNFLIDAQKSLNEILKKEKNEEGGEGEGEDDTTQTIIIIPTIELIPMKRTPAIGAGSGRRAQANDVDLNHPWIGIYQPEFNTNTNTSSKKVETTTTMMDLQDDQDQEDSDDIDNDNDNIPTNPETQLLVAEYGSCAIDLLQSYVDSLVELGRMDDNRLGLYFFKELKINIELQYQVNKKYTSSTTSSTTSTQKRGKGLIEGDGSGGTAPGENNNAVMDGPSEEGDEDDNEDVTATSVDVMNAPIPKKKKKKRKRSGGGGAGGAPTAAQIALKKKEAAKRVNDEIKRQAAILAAVPKSRGSLSLHNSIILTETLNNILSSNVLKHIYTLDLTGLQTLTDDMLLSVVKETGLQLRRLSVKNCRRLTDITIHSLCQHSSNLQSVDIGGDYNIKPRTIIDLLKPQIIRRGRGLFTTLALPHLNELHAGGIGPTGGWNDDILPELFSLRNWIALSIGFSPYLTFEGWKSAIFDVESNHTALLMQAEEVAGCAVDPNTIQSNMCQTLQSLSVPFCEATLIDNAWLGLMGRHLPMLRALDIRGNHQLNSLTGWYDGRATIINDESISKGKAIKPKQSLLVLGRYSGIAAETSKNSVKETKQIYPNAASDDALRVVSNSDGIGWGILRQEQKQNEQTGESSSSSSSIIANHFRYRIHAIKAAAAAAKAEAAKEEKESTSTTTPASASAPAVATVAVVKDDADADADADAAVENNSMDIDLEDGDELI